MWYKLKRSSLAVTMALLLTVLATEASAQCASTEFRDMQKNFSSAQKVQDQAVTRQMQPQSDSTLVLTCFDQQMEVAAQAGEIFSDDIVAPIGVINPLVATGPGSFSYLLTGGLTNSLNAGIKTTVASFFQGMIDDFAGSLTSAVGGVISGILGGFLGGFFDLGGFLGGVDYDCANMQDLWDDNVIGQGINADNVYQDFDELMTGVAPGAGGRFMDALTNNAGVLNDALTDDGTFAAGTFEFQRNVPIFGGGATVADIIAGM